MKETLSKGAINNLLKSLDYKYERYFSLKNDELMHICIGASPTLKKSYKTFIGHWEDFRKAIENNPTTNDRGKK